MNKYTHDEAWEALWKVLLRCDFPLREQVLAEAAARDCHEMDEAEAFVEAFVGRWPKTTPSTDCDER